MVNKELLFSVNKKDFQIDYFSGTGAGGQKRNKTQNCVRIHHKDSGVIVTGQSHKERKSNLREAFQNLIKSTQFKLWHTRRIMECQEGETIKQKVKKSMRSENLKIECKENGKWVEFI